VAKKPVFAKIGPGLGLGYRRNATTGTWVVRAADGQGGNSTKAIGTADDVRLTKTEAHNIQVTKRTGATAKEVIPAPPSGGAGARNRAISDRISWNICRGTATSAIWKVT
jgi:hypothetical protein